MDGPDSAEGLQHPTDIVQLSTQKFSDHRPVLATFDCTVSIIDEPLRDKISREIYAKRKADVGHPTTNVNGEDTDDEELIGLRGD